MEPQNIMSHEYDDMISKIRHSIDSKNKVTLDKFIFLSRLGGGNYGDVYKVLHSETQKNFAIKIIDKQMLFKKNKDSYVRQVLQRLLKSQGLLMQKCNSPYVVKCHEIRDNSRYKIFVLQFCNRGSLYDELIKRRAYPVNDALAILKQIIMGLAQLHKNRIIHRDLKPENIMIHNGKYKIADFGFSKQIEDQHAIAKHTVLGTKVTMAPQVQAGQKYGIKADIWSLGIIFYTMICSSVDFESQMGMGRSRNIQNQIIMEKELFFDTLDGRPDAELKLFIKQMLTFNQKERISWRELINHKIFDRTNLRIFESPILNVKISEVMEKIKQSKENPAVIEETEDEELSAKEHQQRVIDSGEGQKRQINQQNLLKVPPQTNFNIKSTLVISNQQNKDDKNQLKESNNLNTFDLHIDPISNLTHFKQLHHKSDIQKTIFRLIQLNNLQCHKAQYIYQKIILDLEKKNMLTLQRRSHNQFLYLMITRCWINVSWAKNNLQEHQTNQMMVNYYEQVDELYKKIEQKWNEIEKMLLKVQNSLKYRLKDVTSNVFSRESQQNLKTFISGIQTEDYTKQQQIEYTQNTYIDKIMNELKGKERDCFEMKMRLQSYSRVNKISLQELQQRGETFEERVKKVMMG